MNTLIFLWWDYSPSVNLRIVYRAMAKPFGNDLFERELIRKCLARCTVRERQFLVSRKLLGTWE